MSGLVASPENANWAEIVDWSGGGAPRSPRFNDTYFSAEDGLAETRAVFLTGCGLPEAWARRRHFTIGELGFGTGLNILAALELWRRTRPSPDARLHLFSIEAYPIAPLDAARALAHWPDVADLTQPLMQGWPDGRFGGNRIEWPELGAVLDLQIAEVGEALANWTGAADAWFLDGFAPSRNPEMWRDEVLALIARRSRPGARVASFSVAGAVRRGLAAEGFEVQRVPGFGRKKQRLEARLPTQTNDELPLPRVAILGAGIAGAALRRAFVQLGVDARVFDPDGSGTGASGNPAALVTPRLDAGLGAIAALHAQAFARAIHLYRTETPHAVIANGALQLETAPRDSARFGRMASWNGFDRNSLRQLDALGVADALEEPEGAAALVFQDALVVEPKAILDAWLGDALETLAITRIERADGVWRLLDETDATLAEADVVVVAAGVGSSLLTGLPLKPVRGQVSMMHGAFSGAPAAWGGYAIPTRNGLLFGATHDRGDTSSEVLIRDHTRNLATLGMGRPSLASRLVDASLQGRAAIRAATADHLPVAGAVVEREGMFVLAGLGGRGFTLAPILAEQVAAEAIGVGGPLPRALASIVDPRRYAQRL